ncbi:MAG: ATP-binding protein [Chloroflexi bacterium]|nr:ATP-binding protein [Chloroflexota bacterium]
MARFKTRARTVEMLGRQQIAGIPTALSELFKNAHDAYANHVEVDLYRQDSLLVLRDDGLGMTPVEFEDRWLALGTESKIVDDGGLRNVANQLGLPARAILGEKGIGRLAVAAVGPQCLIVTKANRPGRAQPLLVAFVNWSVFALPGVNVDEIEIATKVIEDGNLPTIDDVRELILRVRSSVLGFQGVVPNQLVDEILNELNSFQADPAWLASRLPKIEGNEFGHGTHFYIQPVSENLALDIDQQDKDTAPPLTKMLIGFTNTMVPNHQPPVVEAEFRDHRAIGNTEYLIGEQEFFTPADFAVADHVFQGRVDEFGQFQGTVQIYGQTPVEHTIPWTKARGLPTECGPFKIDLAYAQGLQRDSRLTPERFAQLNQKLNRYGGIYIYRDGIRVLPYGNQDHDFLRIEERRNKSAAYYFFSYRRIFGVISISHESNPNLVEKAGREGFQENHAYRQFRDILEHFFLQMAASFFRETGPNWEMFSDTRAELARRDRIAKQRETQVSVRRRKLQNEIEEGFERFASGQLDNDIAAVFTSLSKALQAVGLITNTSEKVDAIIRAEQTAIEGITRIRDKYRIVEPRGVGLSQTTLRDLATYRAEMARLQSEVLHPATQRVSEEVNNFAQSAGIHIDNRRRFDRSAEATITATRTGARRLRNQAQDALDDVNGRVKTVMNRVTRSLERSLDEILTQAQRSDLTHLDDAELVQLRLEVEQHVELVGSQELGKLESVLDQLTSIVTEPDALGEIVTPIDIAKITEHEVLALRERVETDLELAQLGLATEIINHELQATINGIRSNLRTLRAWTDVNERLRPVYEGISLNFEHLDGYLTLFTPLRRRTNRTKVDIRGGDIGGFLEDLFAARLSRHQCALRSTAAFNRHVWKGYPSTFYPVFVNLVDNAIFWLSDQDQPREVWLDVEGDALLVSDTGPGVSIRDAEAIFEAGFTRKPNGRGLGLYISRDVLERIGYELSVVPRGKRGGATFRITPSSESIDS